MDYGTEPLPPLNLKPFRKGSPIHLNHGDMDNGWGFLGPSMLRARRNQSPKPWIGIRANAGVDRGRAAFSFVNETGGNIRLGWSTADATLELGMDGKSFGFGGTGTKSHNGNYDKWGQTYGKGDVCTALLDLDKHSIMYMVNDHLIPGDAFSIPKYLWGQAFFPHVLVKEATFEVLEGRCHVAPLSLSIVAKALATGAAGGQLAAKPASQLASLCHVWPSSAMRPAVHLRQPPRNMRLHPPASGRSLVHIRHPPAGQTPLSQKRK